MSEEIKNFSEIKQIFASVIEQLKTWSDGQPIQNDINTQEVANTQLDPSRIDSTKPGGSGNHTKEDKFDFLNKQLTGIAMACMALSDRMDACYARLNHHMNRIDNTDDRINQVDDKHSQAMASHMKGHPPALLTASHMKNYLKACDMTADYQEPPKKYIQASKDLFVIKK